MAVSLAVWFDRQVTVNRVIKIALAALEEAEDAVEIVRGYNIKRKIEMDISCLRIRLSCSVCRTRGRIKDGLMNHK